MAGDFLLNSWKEIADYVGRSERTVQRWEKYFGFPVRRPAGKRRSAVIALPSEIETWSQTAPGIDAERQPELVPKQGAQSGKTANEPITLLCIDNHPEGLAVRKILLEAMGYRVFTARDGKAGMQVFENNPVDLVILDYAVPDLQGDLMTHLIHKQYGRVPILMLSAEVRHLPERILKLIDGLVEKGQPSGALLSAVGRLSGAADGARGTSTVLKGRTARSIKAEGDRC
jgi:CheY-like chemotaxis protein